MRHTCRDVLHSGGEKVLRDERESEDEEDNRGESKVKALVRLSN